MTCRVSLIMPNAVVWGRSFFGAGAHLPMGRFEPVAAAPTVYFRGQDGQLYMRAPDGVQDATVSPPPTCAVSGHRSALAAARPRSHPARGALCPAARTRATADR